MCLTAMVVVRGLVYKYINIIPTTLMVAEETTVEIEAFDYRVL